MVDQQRFQAERLRQFRQGLFGLNRLEQVGSAVPGVELTHSLNILINKEQYAPIDAAHTIYPPLLQLPLALAAVRPLNSVQSPELSVRDPKTFTLAIQEQTASLDRMRRTELQNSLEDKSLGSTVVFLRGKNLYGVYDLSDPEIRRDYEAIRGRFGDEFSAEFFRIPQPVNSFMREWNQEMRQVRPQDFRADKDKPYTDFFDLGRITKKFDVGGPYHQQMINYLEEQQNFAAVLPITLKNLGGLVETKVPAVLQILSATKFGTQLISKASKTHLGAFVAQAVAEKGIEYAVQFVEKELSAGLTRSGVFLPPDLRSGQKVPSWSANQGIIANYIPLLRAHAIPTIVESELLAALLSSPQAMTDIRDLRQARGNLRANLNLDQMIVAALNSTKEDMVSKVAEFSGWIGASARTAASNVAAFSGGAASAIRDRASHLLTRNQDE
jgi:hypothetical protein